MNRSKIIATLYLLAGLLFFANTGSRMSIPLGVCFLSLSVIYFQKSREDK